MRVDFHTEEQWQELARQVRESIEQNKTYNLTEAFKQFDQSDLEQNYWHITRVYAEFGRCDEVGRVISVIPSIDEDGVALGYVMNCWTYKYRYEFGTALLASALYVMLYYAQTADQTHHLGEVYGENPDNVV